MATITTKKSIGKHYKLIDFYTYDKTEDDDCDDKKGCELVEDFVAAAQHLLDGRAVAA